MSIVDKASGIKQIITLVCDIVPQIVSLIITLVKSIQEIKTV